MTKNYVVVGGLSGIGQSIVDSLSCDTTSSIIATTRTPDESRVHNSNVSVLQLDLLDTISIDRFIHSVTSEFPCIDGLVLCAGFIQTSPALMASQSLIFDHLQVNFVSQLQILQFLVRKRMLRNKSGSIVYISSSAEKHANAGRLAYAASKAAMSTSMRVLSRELASHGLRFNCVLPGITESKLMRNSTSPSDIDNYIKSIDNKKLADPSEIAPIVSFLLSDSSTHITGQCISVDGGI